MWMNNLTHLFVIICSLSLTVLLIMQVRRIWRIKSSLEKFVSDLQTLKTGLHQIANEVSETIVSASTEAQNEENVCQYCKNRITFVDPNSSELFIYKCRLNNSKIQLSDSCENYIIDLQRYQI